MQDANAWSPFPNSLGEGFLTFVPSFAETPPTVTKELFNETEVTKCLSAAEERVRDDSKMLQLREMKNKVYQVRNEPAHWLVSSIFKLNGDYTVNSSPDVQMDVSAQEE